MRFKIPRPAALDHAGAEAIAAEAASFLTAEPDRLGRFLAETGLDPATLATGLADPQSSAGMLSAILDHIVADESLLLVLASELRQKPEAILRAHALLQGAATCTSP